MTPDDMAYVRSPGGAAARIVDYETGGDFMRVPELLAGIRWVAVDMEVVVMINLSFALGYRRD